MLDFVRGLIPCDVLGKPLGELTLCGLDAAQLREQSHHPEQYFGQPHFMPSAQDSQTLLLLNRVRTVVRQTELAAYAAFRDENGAVTRNDLILALNRLSSLCWIQMCKLKAGRYTHG
jgi:ethanolamine utilization cobalamin adenosyltransferase